MFFVFDLRDSVIVVPTEPIFGHGFPVPASACTEPSAQNSNVFFAVNVEPVYTVRTAPSLFGRVKRLWSAPVGEYG